MSADARTSAGTRLGSAPPHPKPLAPPKDGPGLRAKNQETAPLFNSVTAELTPLSDRKVKVQFKVFRIFGLIPINAPERAVGERRA